MQLLIYMLAIINLSQTSCSISHSNRTKEHVSSDSIIKIEMSLSAFGVESDDFPSIEVHIDFVNNTSNCQKTFYNPAYKDSSYSLNTTDMQRILKLLKISDLEKLKQEYKVTMPDQPSSKTIIYTQKTKYSIDDYGMRGEYPLQELYKIVYKL
jgi:hypothetical protein